MSRQFFWEVTLLDRPSVLLEGDAEVWAVSSSGMLRCWMNCQFWDVTLLSELSVLCCYPSGWAVSSSGMSRCWVSCQFYAVTLLDGPSVLLGGYAAELTASSMLLPFWMGRQFFWDVTLLNELLDLLGCERCSMNCQFFWDVTMRETTRLKVRRRWQIRSSIEFVLK